MYDRSFGVDPLSTASFPELSCDADMDGLSLSEEEESGTNPVIRKSQPSKIYWCRFLF